MGKVTGIIFRFVRVVVVLAVAAGIAFLLYDIREQPAKTKVEQAAPAVAVRLVFPGDRIMTVAAFGTVRPEKVVRIASEIPGRIKTLHPEFLPGGYIGDGELVTGLDDKTIQLENQAAALRVEQAGLDVKNLEQELKNLEKDRLIAEENLALSARELDRVSRLNRQEFASAASYEKVRQQHLNAKGQLQTIENRLSLSSTLMAQKKAALAMAGIDLERTDLTLKKTRIKAPFDGYILEKFTEAGEYINPGQVLATFYHKGRLEVDIRIPMSQMQWLAPLIDAGEKPAARVEMTVSGLQDPVVRQARVKRIHSRVDETTRTLPVTIEILSQEDSPRSVYKIRPGAFVRCIVDGVRHEGLYVLPRHMVKTGDIVYRVTDGHLELVKVTVLRKSEADAYISAGLNPGDQVITSPLPGAVDGMPLTIKQDEEH